MRNTRTNQGGSVLAFIVVGATLAALVVGGVYLAQQRGKEAAKTPPISQQPNKPTTPQTPTPTPSPTPGSTQPKPTPAPSAGNKIPSTGYDSSIIGNQAPQTGSQPTNLPTTGPADTLFQIFAASILVAAVVAFVRSDLAHVRAAKSL